VRAIMSLPPRTRPLKQVSVSTVDKNDDRVTCVSCHFRYPSIRGFCPMCGQLVTAESVALEISQEPKARGLELNRRTVEALQALSSAGRRRLIPVTLSAVVLVCVASYFSFRSRQTMNSPAGLPAAAVTSPRPNPQSAAVPSNTLPAEAEGVVKAKPQPEESSKTTSEDPADLWSRVRKGDADAEVALAKRYLTGVGVERSCEQAHVLLSAASRKQNKAADGLLSGAYAQQCP
jgi:hypothetical protein